MMIERHDTDVLILGSGGAGLFAALHAQQAAPEARITIAVKGLMGGMASGAASAIPTHYHLIERARSISEN